MVKICAISDTHNKHETLNIPDCDILIHCGDMTSMGYEYEIRKFFKWFKNQPAKHHIAIMGNHELKYEASLPSSKTWVHEEFPEIHLLDDSGVKLEGYNFYGSSVTPQFCKWAYNKAKDEEEAQMYGIGLIKPHWDMIPNNTDCLITHGPPYGILDKLQYLNWSQQDPHVGCKHLLHKVNEVKPKLHFFGHIHYGYGHLELNDINYYNVSVCDEGYKPSNAITLINL